MNTFREKLESIMGDFFAAHSFIFEESKSPEPGITYLYYRGPNCKIKFYEENKKGHERNCLIGLPDAPNDFTWREDGQWFFVPELVQEGPHTSESSLNGDCSCFSVLYECFELAAEALSKRNC